MIKLFTPATEGSDKSGALLAYIREFHKERGYPPTRREMQAVMGWSSPNLVEYYLRKLEGAGLVRIDYAVARGTVPLEVSHE